MTRADRRLVAVVLAASACLALLSVPGLAGNSGAVTVTAPGGQTAIDLTRDAEHVIDGALGPVTVAVAEGRADVADSPCPHQVCVAAAPVGPAGGAIVCVPGGITITAKDAGGFDGVVR